MPSPWTFLLGAAVGVIAAVYWAIAQDNNQNNRHQNSRSQRGTPQEKHPRSWNDHDSEEKSSSISKERSTKKLTSRRQKDLPSCAVCMETFNDLVDGGKSLCSLPCGHIFCEKCIRRSLEDSQACPKCRRPAATNQLQYVFL